MTVDRHPCSCCGHLSLPAAGDYELCPICSWEDDGVQLRWPMSRDGANGISLMDAQRAYQRLGAVSERQRRHVRKARSDEPLDTGWRPFDPAVDWTHPELDGERWPRNRETLYYWRDTYWNGDVDRLPAPPRELTGGDHLVEHLRLAVPEIRPFIEHLEELRGHASPTSVCWRLADVTAAAYRGDDPETGLRLVTAMLPALDAEAPEHAPYGVAEGFLGNPVWTQPDLAPFVDEWPAEIGDDFRRQRDRLAAAYHQASGWTDLFATSQGRAVSTIEDDLRSYPIEDHQRALIARVMSDPRWFRHHPVDSVLVAWRHRAEQSPLRTLRWLRRPTFAG